MLSDIVVKNFIQANNQEKVIMLKSMPAELLSVGLNVYANLGDSHEVWLAFLIRIGVNGLKTLPNNIIVERLLPILKNNPTTELIVIVMKAGILIDESLTILPSLLTNANDYTLSEFTDALRVTGERALPVILKMLQEEDPYKLQFAFHSLRIEEWKSKKAIRQISSAVYAVLQNSNERFIIEHAAHVLQTTAPKLLVKYAIDVMKSWEKEKSYDHPLRRSSKEVVKAYNSISDTKLKQQFLIASIENDMPWWEMNRWEALVSLVKMGPDKFKKLFVRISNHMRQNLGSAMRFTGDYPSYEVEQVVNVTTAVIFKILEEDYPTDILSGFLTQAQNSFKEDDYVKFMLMVQEKDGDVGELAQYYYYQECTPEQVSDYMENLSGSAKTYAALMILHKLKDILNGYEKHEVAFNAAMDVITKAYTQPNLPISKQSDEAVQKIPLKYWKVYLEKILTNGTPYWAVRFAIFTLNFDKNHQLANETLARVMMIDDKDVQWNITKYLNN